MKKIFIKKSVIVGSTMHKPGKELLIPKDISENEAQGFIESGRAVDAALKEPDPEKEAAVIGAIGAATIPSQVEKAVDSVEKPTPEILEAAETKVKSFFKRPPAKKPGERK